MALNLSTLANVLSKEINIEANLILEIDGFDLIFGAVEITRLLRIGDFIIGDGSKIGGIIEDEKGRDWIDLKGTTTTVNQKINPDKDGSSSITSFTVSLIDKADTLTKIFAPSNTVPDILGREATFYWSPQGAAHPRDSVAIFVGIISSIDYGAGFIQLRVDHPEQLKRTDLLPKITTKLTADIDDSTLIIPVETTEGIIPSQDNLLTYIRVNDELMQVGSYTETEITLLNRAQLTTVANAHESGDELDTFYRLQGNATELTLKLLLSNPDSLTYATEVATSFNQVTSLININNSVMFNGVERLEQVYGITSGDTVTITGATNPANNVVDAPIISVEEIDQGSYIILGDSVNLVDALEESATVTFKSQYNTLSFGAGLKPYQVDIDQFNFIANLFSAQLPEYDFYLKDGINLKEFIDSEVLFPSGIFTVPRKGRISINKAAPPIASAETPKLNETNVKNATRIRINRSFNQRFYNAVQYRFNEDSLDDRFLSGEIFLSAESVERIPIGNRVLKIDSKGLRDNADSLQLVETNALRYLDRYQFGAEQLKLDVNFATGFSIEISDSVILEGAGLKLSDSNNGTRDFSPRVMEVVNKSFNLKAGAITLTLVDSSFSARARYGTIAPSSRLGSGSTTTTLTLKRSYGTLDTEFERDKWEQYVGQRIRIRSDDFSTDLETRIFRLSPSNPNVLEVNPALPFAPSEDLIVDVPEYDEDDQFLGLYKALHCFFTPAVNVVSQSGADIVVDSSDIDKFIVGYPVLLHNSDYSNTLETNVSTINVGTNTITLSTAPTFTADNTYQLQLIGFSDDNGLPYRWF